MAATPPPQLSPDGKFYWDGERWLPMPSAMPPVAPQPPRKNHAGRNVLIGLAVVIVVAALGSAAGKPTASTSSSPAPATASTPVFTPAPTPTPVSESDFKASSQSVPYPQLVKDPASMAGTRVTYRAQVFQYDSRTTTSHMLVYVTQGQFFWSDLVVLDLRGNLASNDITQTQTIQFWGTVVGAYSYDTSGGGKNTVPEIEVKYIQHAS